MLLLLKYKTLSLVLFILIISTLIFLLLSPISHEAKTNNGRKKQRFFQQNVDNCHLTETLLDIFIPSPPTDEGFEELANLSLKSLALFWPLNQTRVKIITDELNDKSKEWSERVRKTAQNYNIVDGNNFKVIHTEEAFPMPNGWHRQQWLMFWADNFTDSDYVAFLDSDAVFVTFVTRRDLFDGDRPIIRGIYGPPPPDTPFWEKVPQMTSKVIGKDEPMKCMSYFPVVLHRRHFKLIRDHIRQRLGEQTFDEAFRSLILVTKGVYSQFSLFCTYLWHFQHSDYFWIINRNHYGGGLVPGQIATIDQQHYFKRKRPHLCIHWHYEPFGKKKREFLNEIFLTGFCYLEILRKNHTDLCSSIVNDRFSSINKYEWTFESIFYAADSSDIEQHKERIGHLDHCRSVESLNQQFIDRIFNESNQ